MWCNKHDEWALILYSQTVFRVASAPVKTCYRIELTLRPLLCLYSSSQRACESALKKMNRNLFLLSSQGWEVGLKLSIGVTMLISKISVFLLKLRQLYLLLGGKYYISTHTHICIAENANNLLREMFWFCAKGSKLSHIMRK